MSAGDEALYCRLYSDPEVMRHIGAPLSAEAAARAFAAALHLAVQPDPRLRVWVLSERATALGIGILALSGRASGEALESGAMLLPQGQARGFSVEAHAALLDRLFATTRIATVWSRNSERNEAAASVRAKLGFLKSPASGEGETSVRWQISREQWLVLRRASADLVESCAGR